MSDLILDFCSHEAATYAVMRWHYSRQMPKSKLVKIGVWEVDQVITPDKRVTDNKRFVGAIIYGLGANRHIARPFNLQPTEVCELVRVALAPQSTRLHPTSACVARSIKLLKKQSTGLRLIVSYADTKEGHLGIIYQATNWIFLGGSVQPYIRVLGRVEHPRTLWDRYGKQGQSIPWLKANIDRNACRVEMPAKLKYVYPLDKSTRNKLLPSAKPYPKKMEET